MQENKEKVLEKKELITRSENGVGAVEGRRSAAAVRLGGGAGRRGPGNGVVVLLVDGVVKAVSRESVGQTLVHFG